MKAQPPEEPYRGPPLCGAKLRRKDATCKNPAGYKTDHVGTGKCYLHGGATPIKHGRYSGITRPRIAELLAVMAADPDPMDLKQEVFLLRALVLDFVERYDQHTEALIAWHSSFGQGFTEAVALWREKLARWTEERDQGLESDPPPPPIPEAFERKPRQLPDILAVGGFLDKIGALVERVQKKEAEQRVTLTDLNRILTECGVEVVRAAQVHLDDEDQRAAFVRDVEERWTNIRL